MIIDSQDKAILEAAKRICNEIDREVTDDIWEMRPIEVWRRTRVQMVADEVSQTIHRLFTMIEIVEEAEAEENVLANDETD